MKIRLLAAISALLLAMNSFGAAARGNCQAMAVALRASQNVKLVDEWDPEMRSYWGSGAYYYKVTLMKGQAYTIWITGGNVSEMGLWVTTDYLDESAPYASFQYQDFKGETLRAAFLSSEDWFEDDPASGTFYVVLTGDIGAQTTLFFTTGIQNFLEEGSEGNPRRLTFSETVQTDARALLADEYVAGRGDYYYSARLTAGNKYRFRLNGSTAANPLSLDVSGANYFMEDDPLFTNRTDIAVKLIYPGETADYVFNISSTNQATQAFSINYMAYKTRLPAQHPDISPLTAANAYAASVQPGREVADADTYYDAVIDESLLSISVKKGERWVFQTEDATYPIMMRAYDASGKILNENTTMGNGVFDTRTVITASADAQYYVGVCDPNLDIVSVPQGSNVTVFAKNALDFNGPDDSDAFDTADDTLEGASMLVAYPGSISSSVSQVAQGHGPHVLSGGDWYDWFKFPGRKGVTYALRASFVGKSASDVPLNGVVYKVVSGVRTRVSAGGTLSPAEIAPETANLTFIADEDAMYYVCVYAGTGGQDYPAYNMHAMAYVTGTEIGLLRVTTKGVDGTWRLASGSFFYPNGASVVAPVGRDFAIAFPDVSGFKTPASVVTNVEAYVAGGSETVSEVIGVYTDTADPGDNVYTGFVRIAPETKTSKAQRTLWTDDPADHFLFRAETGRYYNFMIIDRTQGNTGGDAVFSIASAKTVADLDKPFVSAATQYMKKSFEAGGYLLKVTHANADNPVDSSYVLAYNSVDVGTVQFATSPVLVSESAEYAEIKVTRTSSDGAVRVRWTTEAGTAKPGSEYYPADGVLSWENGDMSPQTIRVRLIPDLKGKWEPTLYFAVKIQPLTADCWAADEYGAVISGPSKIPVKLTEDSAKATGTIAVKAAPRAVAGDALAVTLTRTGGADGSVGVVVATVNGTAARGTDFDSVQTNLVWEAGDTSDKTFTVQTHAVGSKDDKTFVLKIGSLKAVFPAQYGSLDEPASISAANTTATIASELVGRTLEDLMTEPSYAGIRATALAGDLYVDASGALRTSVVPAGGKVMFRFGVTGPGLFVMEPRLENVAPGDEPNFKFQMSGGEILDCSSGDRIVLAVPSGYRNVAFVARSASGTAYASLQPLAETGLPFKWIPFSDVAPVDPPDGAVVDASIGRVSWTEPPGRTGEEIWYRVKASARGTDPSTFTAEFTNMTTDLSCAIPAGLLITGRQFWWRVDYAYIGSKPEPEEADWLEGPSAWTFRTAAAGAPATEPSSFATDANGRLVKELIAKGEPVGLVQGARVDFSLAVSGGGAVTSASVVAGTLPPGTKLTPAGRLYGVPGQAGDFRALVQANGGTTLTLDFHVAPIGSAAGSFCAVLREDGTAAAAFARIGALSFSTTEAGALSAKAKVGGVMHAFASSGYEEVLDHDDSAPGQTMRLVARMYETVAVGEMPCTNVLEVAVGSGSLTNLVALGQSAGTAQLTLNVDDGGVPREVKYVCELVRRNADSAAFVDAMAPFAGYYTASIVPYGTTASAGLPCGNGPMALTVSADGTVKVSGVLPDQTSFSSSAYCALEGDLSDPDSAVLLVPVMFASSPNAFGGLLKIRHAEAEVGGETVPASYVDSYAELEWNKSGGAFDGTDFTLAVNPVGGWYDTVVNLQRYYLDRDFSVEAEPVAGIPEGMLPAGYTYTVDTTPHGVEATLAGNALNVEARKIVKDGARVDFGASVNAWNVTLGFARGSGLVKGTATVVSDGDTQVMLGTINHFGILLMNRDARAPLDADVWTAGFYLFPAGNGWKHSLPFNIRSTTVDRDWSEAELPDPE